MSAGTVETSTPTSVRERIAEARAARDEGFAQAETGISKQWDIALIDQAIAAFALTEQPFSANELRELLPDVCTPLMGSRFYAASIRDEIRKVDPLGVTSTKKNTHSKPVGLWISTAVPVDDEGAA